MRTVIAITGASGAIYGIRALEILKSLGVEAHLILSDTARLTIPQETTWDAGAVERLAVKSYHPSDIGAALASGSFHTDGMAVMPCSIKTLSAVANSYAHDLIVRAADVHLKEGRPLILMVRETPLHRGHLRLMDLAASAGAVIFPPVPALYGTMTTLQEVIDATVGRILARLGIENDYYPKWEGI